MSREGLADVWVPTELVNEVDKIVDQRFLGFSSRVEFVADAIRRRLEQMVQLGLWSGLKYGVPTNQPDSPVANDAGR